MAKVKVAYRIVHSASLMKSYMAGKRDYHRGYPVGIKPACLYDGVECLFRKFTGDEPDARQCVLYIVENERDEEHPDDAMYAITLTRHEKAYALGLVYSGTQEMESLSTFEPNRTVWSADTMANTRHVLRTKYYLGMIYLIARESLKLRGL